MALQNETSLGRDCLHSVGHNLNTSIQMKPSCTKNMNFKEFCSAAISVYQLEAPENFDKIATNAFQYFEQEGYRVITVEELTKEMNLDPRAYALIKHWMECSHGKLNFLGHTQFLHGVTIRSSSTGQ